MEKTQVGPFLILKKLGTSSRHRVYHARQTEQNRDVALKFISVPPGVPRSKAIDKIEREANALQQLEHPNLIRVHGAGVDNEQIFFATELVDGESLTSLLARRDRLSIDLATDLGTQLASLLQYLHQQDLVHSKLTPDKILVTPENTVKVADLRLNRARRRRWDAAQRRELDIAAYLAPEQFSVGATAKSDLYSLGVILYEMLTGKLPYSPDTMARMNQKKMKSPVPSVAKDVMGCPVWLDKVVTQLLDPDPRKRPNSSRAVWMTFKEIRKAEAGRKATVDHVSETFNPLNAGVDKTEARQLLGETQPTPGPQIPFYQQVPFLVTALLSIVAVIAFLAVPVSKQKIVADARSMIASDKSSQWTQAREMLAPIMAGNSELANEAEKLYYQSKQKTLIRHADLELDHGLQSKPAKQYIEAVQLQKKGQSLEALRAFAILLAKFGPDSGERHIHFAAKDNLESLIQKFELPRDPSQLLALIEQLKLAQSDGDLIAARQLLGAIMIRNAGDSDYVGVVQAAHAALLLVDQRSKGSLNLDAIKKSVKTGSSAEHKQAHSGQPKL